MCDKENCCSYWITIVGPIAAVDAAQTAMEELEAVREFLDKTDWSDKKDGYKGIQYSVKEDLGIISRWPEMAAELAKVAAAAPEVTISAEEIDEEYGEFHELYRFRDGKLLENLHGRRIGPEELDSVTVYACIDRLKDEGMEDAAKLLEELLS